MDNPLLIIGALLAAYWYYSNYMSPSPTATSGTATGTTVTPFPITAPPVTPSSVAAQVPATAGPTLPASQIPTFNGSQWSTAGQPTPNSFFASGPTGGGLTPAPEWNSGIGGNKTASGWLYADGSIYFESGPAAGQASGPPASAWGGNSSMAALANNVPVSPNAVMQTIAGA